MNKHSNTCYVVLHKLSKFSVETMMMLPLPLNVWKMCTLWFHRIYMNNCVWYVTLCTCTFVWPSIGGLHRMNDSLFYWLSLYTRILLNWKFWMACAFATNAQWICGWIKINGNRWFLHNLLEMNQLECIEIMREWAILYS